MPKSLVPWIDVGATKRYHVTQLPDFLSNLEVPGSSPLDCDDLHKPYGNKMKDLVYGYAKAHHLNAYGIKGNYVGLAAGRLYSLSKFLGQHVQSFDSCEKKKSFAEKYKVFGEQLNKLRAATLPRVSVSHADIVTFLENSEKKYSVFDLDFMTSVDTDSFDKIIRAVLKTCDDKCTVLLWHCIARSTTKNYVEKMLRPYIYNSLHSLTDLVDYDWIRYYEGYPMGCEIFTFQKPGIESLTNEI